MITHVVCKSLALEDSFVWKMLNDSSFKWRFKNTVTSEQYAQP